METTIQKVLFNKSKNSIEFQNELNSRVNRYFEEKDIKKTGDARLYVKTAILIPCALTLYSILVFFPPGHYAWWIIVIKLVLCSLLGFCIALIGFNVMHDASHGSFSSQSRVNKFWKHVLEGVGASSFLWKKKHVEMHHTAPNVDHHDDDINFYPFLRVLKKNKLRWFHRLQAYYAPILYGLLYFLWIFFFDIHKYFRGSIGSHQIKMKPKDHIIFWTSKIIYVFMVIVLPCMLVGVSNTLVGFSVMCATTGLTISLIFQLAHIVEGSQFHQVEENTGALTISWVDLQIAETSDFAVKSKLAFWLFGGLNFQVEHHLFPKISHVHYPAIQPIVKEVCEKYGRQYKASPMWQALKSHFAYIHKMGKPDYSQMKIA